MDSEVTIDNEGLVKRLLKVKRPDNRVVKNVVMMCGLPASGKSTYLNNRINLSEDSIVLSSDDMIDSIAESVKLTYNEVFNDTIKYAESNFWYLFDQQLNHNFDSTIILDRTFLTKKSRKKVFDLVNKYRVANFRHNHNVICYHMRIHSQQDWKRRLNNRPGKTIPPNILNSMINSYETPHALEGFSHVAHI